MNIAINKLSQVSVMKACFNEMRDAFSKNKWPSLSERTANLKVIKRSLLSHEAELIEALTQDYGQRSEFDSLLGDIMPAMQHLNYTRKHLAKWLKADSRNAGLALTPSRIKVERQPLGVVGIIVPWNFPIFLSLGPIITALAAGNKVMVKLSEFTPNTNAVLRKVLTPLAHSLTIIEGEAAVASEFSQLKFDHLFFTGSTQIGRHVASACAENLTPVTLELGGKSPVIIASDTDIAQCIDTILMGKSINAGQICVAPDYILLPKGRKGEFISLYLERFQKYYGNALSDYASIINQRQFERLVTLLNDAKKKGAQIHSCAEINNDKRVLPPQLICQVTEDMAVMQSEIFGPLLPIVEYQDISDAITYINQRPRPLALYLMSKNKQTQRKVIEQTHSGGVCINDTLLHVGADDAPFGGIGESGLGQYHGKEGFDTFTKAKTVLHSPAWLPRSRLILANKKHALKLFKMIFVR